ncbi:hypothetical protein [Halorussus amylolyticus]|uniref:hypothetical protein n=1 Tax=Halorussus amylolyticus TaxID=1126242 RepID=UPI0010472B8D|nr:hypothetical protein [Halorussus amylolyticus]
MATGRDTQLPLAAWGLAGVPILATFVQTTLAVAETTLGSAGLSGVQDAIRSVAVFDAAAILMWQSPGLVSGLFVLIAGAWAAQGVAQFGRHNRDVTFAAAGLVSVLFFALFFGVYFPMFGSDVPLVQVLGFFAVPVVASGAAVGSALGHDWDEKVVEEKSAELAAVASDLDRKREAFEEAYRRRIGDLDALADIAPNGVERARERRREFRERCDGLESDVAAAGRGSADQLRAEASSLASRVESLDPETEVGRIEDDLRERVASGVRTTYGTVQCWSRYDRSYELVNLPSRFRDVEIQAFDTAVHVGRIDEAFLSRLDEGADLETVAQAVGEVDDHVGRIEAYVGQYESSFAERADAAGSDIETVETKCDRFEGRVADRLSELVVEGRDGDLPSVRGVRERLDSGRDALHDCRFDEAERAAEEAAEDASEAVTLVEFLWSVVGTIDHRGERVSLPASVDPTAIERLRPAFEREYGVEFRVADGALELTYRERAGETEPGDESEGGSESGVGGEVAAHERGEADVRTESDGQVERARPEEVIDSVLFVFRELKTAGRATDGDHAEIQTGELPESVATPAVLTQIRRFGQRQTDVLETLDVQENAPPGFIELVPKEGTSVEAAADALHERYREQYG